MLRRMLRALRMAGLGLGMALLPALPSVWAADGDTATHEQILQTIEATRQTDPELATEMERQLELLESGQGHGEGERTTLPPELVGPPVEEGSTVEQDPRYQQVQSDPRMQEVHEQYESGNLTEAQAREQVSEILRDHGIEPDEGREWEHPSEHSEGFERAWERMAPEAREQMERQMVERISESAERTYESPQEHAHEEYPHP